MSLISYGTTADFEAQWYGIPDQQAIQYMEQDRQRFLSNLLPSSQTIFKGLTDGIFGAIDYQEAFRRGRAFGRRVATLFMADEIQRISKIAEFQHAPITMQRWIMAEPTVRQMYFDQKVDGYSDTYVTKDQNVGMMHEDYQKVINGVYLEDENGDIVITEFYNLYEEDERPLDIMEQVDILDTWSMLKSYLAKGGDDPTSKYNASL